MERPANRRPNGEQIHPDFDGHPERSLLEMTAEEKLDWIWEAMQLLRAGEEERLRRVGLRP